jgi:hypothetical protein
MKEIHEYEEDLASVRSLMERSSRFISLSGLSGILAGIYALAGATAAYFIVHYPISPLHYRIYSVQDADVLWKLILLASLVLVASLTTGIWLTQRKAKRRNTEFWNKATKQMLINLSIPLVAGGLFILIILSSGHFGLAAPACLLFYGLALIQASNNTVNEIRYLGFSEIVLGLISAMLPGYGLIFWALGFGVLHIFYGAIMHNRYDK